MMQGGKILLTCLNCLLITTGAYEAGGLAAGVLEQRIIEQETPPLISPVVTPETHTPSQRSADYSEFAAILDRNVFKAERRPTPPSPPKLEEVVVVENVADPVKSTGPVFTELKLVLTGTMIYNHNAFAFIAAANKPASYKIYQIGDCFEPESVNESKDIPCPPKKVKVFEIRDREIAIIYQGREEILSMDKQTEAVQAAVASAPKPEPSRPKPKQRAKPVQNQQKVVLKPIRLNDPGPLIIKPTIGGKNEAPPDGQRIFRFERTYVDEQLANFSQLLNDARVVPTEKDGTPLFMFKFIRKGSIYEKLGLKNEDIILAINSFTVDSVPKALKLFETLQSEREITLKIERDGQATDFQYYID
jgi:hypothetical protein